MLFKNRQFSRPIFTAFVVLLMSQAPIAKALDLKILDKNGQAVANAVVSFPQIKVEKQTTQAIMDQVDKQFAPYVLIIQKNQMVDFPNSDAVRHHVYSFSQANQFEIQLFSGSEAKPLAFKNEGVVVLGCNIHDNMIGYIYINGGELTAMTDNLGEVSIPLPDGIKSAAEVELTVWHPELSPMQTKRVSVRLPSNTKNHRITLPFGLDIEKPEINTGFKKKFGN
jgi:plastocyanin